MPLLFNNVTYISFIPVTYCTLHSHWYKLLIQLNLKLQLRIIVLFVKCTLQIALVNYWFENRQFRLLFGRSNLWKYVAKAFIQEAQNVFEIDYQENTTCGAYGVLCLWRDWYHCRRTIAGSFASPVIYIPTQIVHYKDIEMRLQTDEKTTHDNLASKRKQRLVSRKETKKSTMIQRMESESGRPVESMHID